MLERLRDVFVATAVKRMSQADTMVAKSHQHEVGGLVKGGFGLLLGNDTERTGKKFPYSVTCVWLEDGEEPVVAKSAATWYDTRYKKKETRKPEYRLYYIDNAVTNEFRVDGLFLISLTVTSELLIIATPPDSEYIQQLATIFGFDAESLAPQPMRVDLDAQKISLPLELMFKNQFGIDLTPSKNIDEDVVKAEFGTKFPSSTEFSNFIQEKLCLTIDPVKDPDEALLTLMTNEERYFRAMEFIVAKQELKEKFDPKTIIDLDDLTHEELNAFMSVSLSFQNRRKSRAGHAFENNIQFILTRNELYFEPQVRTEDKRRPDFIFPGEKAYHDPNFPSTKLRMLAAKTTCKDRWRQVCNEAARIPHKHLITIEPAISVDQTREMQSENVTLVVPLPLHATYDLEQQGDVLSTFKDFIEEVKML